MTKYNIEAGRTSKPYNIMRALESCNMLTVENYVKNIVKDTDVVKYSGVLADTLARWKRKGSFTYDAVREKTIRCMIDELQGV